MRLLLVEDDNNFGYILKEYLQMHMFDVSWIKDGREASAVFKEEAFDLVILDIMLPNKDGFSLAREIRETDPRLPLIFLTAKSLKVDKLKGFQLGADDYVTKPIDEEVFIARINALLKRSSFSGSSNEQLISIGNYLFDYHNQLLTYEGKKRTLTIRESQVLKILCENRNKVLDRKKVLTELWGRNDMFSRKSMDVFIFRLRKYLAQDKNIRITNVHGKGFILEVDK